MEKKIYYKFYFWVINLLVCLFAMKTFIFNRHFSVDDYSLFYSQSVSLALADMSGHMRIVSNSIMILLCLLDINVVECQVFFGALLVAAFAWAITKISLEMFGILQETAESDNSINNAAIELLFIAGGASILFINAFMSENLYFGGVYLQWIIGATSMAYAAIHLGRNEKIIKNWLIGVIALFATLGSYQLFVAEYAYIVMTFIFVKNKGKMNRNSVLAVFRAAAAPAAALCLQIVCINILVHMKVIEENSALMTINLLQIPDVILQILQTQKSIWIDGGGMYPKYTLISALLLMLGVLAILMHKKKTCFKECIFAIIVLISGQCVTYLPELVQGSAVFMPPRILFPIFGVYTAGLFLIYFYSCDADKGLIKKLGGMMIIIFLVFSSIKIDEVAVDTAKTNALTQCYVDEIINRIEKYEKQSGIEVTKVGFCYDAGIGSIRYWKFLGGRASWVGNVCENPFVRPWSDVNAIIYHSGRNFTKVDVPENIIEYYSSQNWDAADWDSQLFFDNDAMYVCVY